MPSVAMNLSDPPRYGPPRPHQFLLGLGDWLCLQAAVFLGDWLRRYLPIGAYPDKEYVTPLILIVVSLIWLAVFVLWGVYDWRNQKERVTEFRALVTAVSFSLFTFASFIYFLKIENFSRLLFVYIYVLDLTLSLGFRIVARWVFRRLRIGGAYGTRRAIIVGFDREGQELAARLRTWADSELIGFVDDGISDGPQPLTYLGPLQEIEALVARLGIDEVIITASARSRANLPDIIARLHDRVRIKMIPDLLEMIAVRTRIEDLHGIPLVTLREPAIVGINQWIKRSLDLVGAVLGLIVFAPVMLVLALIIKLDSTGPVFFVQERAGQYGKPFRMFKFRTMVPDAEEKLTSLIDLDHLEQPQFKLKSDPRVTRIGKWFRRFSLDELPQLFNVLRGEMSLVGPRPEEIRLVNRYSPWQSQRLLLKPGMTGATQISGRGDLSLDERVSLELAYTENYSLWEDIKILIKTVPAVLSGKGAY